MDKMYCDYLDWVESKCKERRELELIYRAIINHSDLETFNKYFMPLSKLDDIRAEIEQEYSRLSATRADETLELGECLGLKMVLKIIDKYKAEVESGEEAMDKVGFLYPAPRMEPDNCGNYVVMQPKQETVTEFADKCRECGAKYGRALSIACSLMNGDSIYGVDSDILFVKVLEQEGCVNGLSYEHFILENLDRFSDDDDIREKAIKRLGW